MTNQEQYFQDKEKALEQSSTIKDLIAVLSDKDNRLITIWKKRFNREAKGNFNKVTTQNSTVTRSPLWTGSETTQRRI